MITYRRHIAVGGLLLIIALLVVSSSIPATALTGSPTSERSHATSTSEPIEHAGTPPAPATAPSRTIGLTQELQLTPENPGEITVTLRYSIPSDVVDLKTRIPSRATVTSTTGLVQRDSTEYAWDKQTSTPSVTYRVSVNETLDVTGPIAGKGDYTFVDPGPWALVRIPPTATGWSWTGDSTVDISRTVTTTGPGAVGDTMAFLGDHREVTQTANGQTFRLIIPARATLAESPASILDSMASASNTLQVGDRDDRVFMIAAPTKSTRWGVRGLQTGDADVWVRDSERLDTADNVWLHEYVHTRQDYAAATDVRWFTEASATYYAALLTLEQDRISFDAFRTRLALGTRTPDTNAVLADPATWDTVAPYTKGALVAGELDRDTRTATERTRSLQNVFSQLNSNGGTVTGSAFREIVRQVGGESTASIASQYTTSQDTPPVWDQSVHGSTFGTTPARIGYTLPAPDSSAGYRVSGPYRTGGIGGGQPLQLVVGEALAVDVHASNTGGTAGRYDAELLVNGQAQEQQTGTLEQSETRTLTFTHRFLDVGEYTLTVGGERVAVSVREPAKPTVTAVNATQTTRRQQEGSVVSVTATVRNDQSFPAAANLTLYRNSEPVETRHVKLASNEERTITYNGTVVGPGDYVFHVDNQTTTVTIESTPTASPTTVTVEPTPTVSPTTNPRTTSTSADGDGFGGVAALIAILGFVGFLYRWRVL